MKGELTELERVLLENIALREHIDNLTQQLTDSNLKLSKLEIEKERQRVKGLIVKERDIDIAKNTIEVSLQEGTITVRPKE